MAATLCVCVRVIPMAVISPSITVFGLSLHFLSQNKWLAAEINYEYRYDLDASICIPFRLLNYNFRLIGSQAPHQIASVQ